MATRRQSKRTRRLRRTKMTTRAYQTDLEAKKLYIILLDLLMYIDHMSFQTFRPIKL